MEAAIVMVIVGVGIVSLVQLLACGTMANTESTELTSAMGLASNIHEMSLGVAYSQIMTLNGQTYSPPIDARQVAISGMPGWSQVVSVSFVNPDSLTATVASSPSQPTARVTVTIMHNNLAVYSTDWLATALTWP